MIEGNIGIIQLEDQNYFVSVGVANIKSRNNKDLINAIKSARLKANNNLMKYIHGTIIKSKEELVSKTTTIKINENGEIIEADRTKQEEYIEIIQEKGKGLLKNIKDFGEWKSIDKKKYYRVVGFKL